MNRVVLSQIPLEAHRVAGWRRMVRGILLGLFILQVLFVCARLWWPLGSVGKGRWPDGLLVVLAAATTVASLTRQLPGQNVILASLLIAALGGAAHTLGALTAIPFGPFQFKENAGQPLFPPLPWAIPMVWLIILVNARGVARLILRPWRKSRTYGFQLIGVTALMVVLFDISLEPYAVGVKQFWVWGETKIPFTWYGAPIVNFLGWMLVALLILAFVTPALINKKPVRHPADFSPLAVWMLLQLLFLTGALAHQFTPAAATDAALTGLVAALAVYGGRQQP